MLQMLFTTALFAVMWLVALSPYSVASVIKFNDLGDEDDFNPKSDIFLLPGSGRWSPFVCHENPDLLDGWEMYTSRHRGERGWISFRIVYGDLYGDFYARTSGFKLTAEKRNATTLYLAIRYKDTVLSPELDLSASCLAIAPANPKWESAFQVRQSCSWKLSCSKHRMNSEGCCGHAPS